MSSGFAWDMPKSGAVHMLGHADEPAMEAGEKRFPRGGEGQAPAHLTPALALVFEAGLG